VRYHAVPPLKNTHPSQQNAQKPPSHQVGVGSNAAADCIRLLAALIPWLPIDSDSWIPASTAAKSAGRWAPPVAGENPFLTSIDQWLPPETKIHGFLSAMLNMLQWNGHLPLSSLEASTHHRVVCDHIGDLVATVRGQLVVPGRASWTSDVLAFLALLLIVFRTSPSFLVHVLWSYISYHIIWYP
jgi:hypothetical protein